MGEGEGEGEGDGDGDGVFSLRVRGRLAGHVISLAVGGAVGVSRQLHVG